MRFLFAILFSISLFLSCGREKPADIEARVVEARALVREFGGTLKPILVSHFKQDGPVAAIEVCSKSAPEIAQNISNKSGWDVKRVSHKPRNGQSGRADEWELGVLQRFIDARKAGADVDTLEHYEVLSMEDGSRTFRYMKPQKTLKLCTACHGTSIDPAVSAKLLERYPNDVARGFKEGDVRGAFSLKMRLN